VEEDGASKHSLQKVVLLLETTAYTSKESSHFVFSNMRLVWRL